MLDFSQNPFRPGAGHPPPFLAGREREKQDFLKTTSQNPILTNLVLTGLRGVGKTVLLEEFKRLAIQQGWLWAGTDLSESASVNEDSIALRILADLAPLVSGLVIREREFRQIGFGAPQKKLQDRLDFALMKHIFEQVPGLVSDKLKSVLEFVWHGVKGTRCRGIVLAYDEAQNLSDQAAQQQYPLSLLLDVFQSLQKKQFPYLMVLTGLPTLFPKLVNARTFSERMFHVMTLDRLSAAESRDAILKPLQNIAGGPRFDEVTVKAIVTYSGGYPYFIQFLCREILDLLIQQGASGTGKSRPAVGGIVRKLDGDFFAGRWNRTTDRQRELLSVVAMLENCNEEFSVQEIVEKSRQALPRPFSASHVNQILVKLTENGLVYKNRHGRYSFAVPLLGDFILRQAEEGAQA